MERSASRQSGSWTDCSSRWSSPTVASCAESSRHEGVAGMSDETTTIRARLLPDGTVVQVLPDGTTRPFEDEDRTDWARLAAMTEEEIEATALAEPDRATEPEQRNATRWG